MYILSLRMSTFNEVDTFLSLFFDKINIVSYGNILGLQNLIARQRLYFVTFTHTTTENHVGSYNTCAFPRGATRINAGVHMREQRF